jgi:hypothetical protein
LAVPVLDQPIYIDSNDSNNKNVLDETPSKILKLSSDFFVLSPSTCTRSEDVVIARLEALDSIRDYTKMEGGC